ncbi:MAG: hypothetical protein Q9221_006704 [Calogaya cf. arnoldii]
MFRTSTEPGTPRQPESGATQDHPEACGGALTPIPKKPFRFLNLLPELRTEIYSLLLCRSQLLMQMEPDQSGPEHGHYDEAGNDEQMGPVDVRLFVVCKQVYEEATTVFFGQNTFRIQLIGSEYLSLPSPMFRTDFQPTDQSLIAKLKRIDVVVRPGRKCDWALKLVCRELANRASLKEVKINIYPFVDRDTDDETIDEMFEIFTTVRGVGNVVINDSTRYGDNAELPMLGSQAQRDRVKRLMTTSR